MPRRRHAVVVLLALALLWLSPRPAPAASIAPGDVRINEFVAAPQSSQPSEWVELVNTTPTTVDIGGLWLDDVAGGGGSPQQIPAGTQVAPGGYYLITLGSYLNNGGDDVRLLAEDGVTVLDSTSYTSASYDMSWCRQPDGGAWSPVECNPTPGATNGGSAPLWQPGTFALYFFDVEQAHSHLLVTPSGHSMLIEAGETNWNSGQNAARIAAGIQSVLGHRNLTYMAVGHQHLDHIGYVGYGGFWSLLEEHDVTATALFDRDSGTWVDSNNDGICDPDQEIQWHNAGTVSGTSRLWLCYATDPGTRAGQIRQVLPVGSVISFGDGVTATLVMQDAQGVMQVDGVTPVAGNHTAAALPTSENDYSQNWLIRFGRLEVLSGSDTDGEYATSSWGYSYNDIETHVAAAIGQPIEVLHVNHHGSAHSTNEGFLDVLQPDVAVISCGSNSYGHPAQGTLDRLTSRGAAVYQTNLCDPTRDYTGVTITESNFELRSTDGISYDVVGYASYTATDPAPPAGPQDVLINEILPAPTGGATEWVEFYNPTAQTISLGGMWIDDIMGGGGAPQQIPAGTQIAPGGFWVWETASGYLNNGGDDVRYLAADGVTVYDSISYPSTQNNRSRRRMPDGGAWDSAADATPTKGAPNN